MDQTNLFLFTGSNRYSYANGFCYDLNQRQIVSFKLKPTGCDSDVTNVPVDKAGISEDQIEPMQTRLLRGFIEDMNKTDQGSPKIEIHNTGSAYDGESFTYFAVFANDEEENMSCSSILEEYQKQFDTKVEEKSSVN